MNFWKDKKVLITGHTGFKGSWLSLWLTMLGAKVYGYALKPPTEPNLYDLCRLDQMVDSTISDIRNLDKLDEVFGRIKPEIVFHMAAQSLVRDSYKIPVETFDINVMGTVNLFEAVRTCGEIKTVVNVTTDKVYENTNKKSGYRENEAFGGYDPYSASKACSEIVTSSFRRSFFKDNVAVASARAGNVIGGGDFATDRLIPDFVRSIASKQSIEIRNPKAVRPWQYVLDPLHGYMILAEKLFNHGNKYAQGWNFGPDAADKKNVEWIVKAICKKWDGNASYNIDRSKHPHEAENLMLDSSKAKKLLKWKSKYDIGSGLDKVVEWTKEYIDGKNARDICLKQICEYHGK